MIDIQHLLASLALRQPIFHSEADFQHALAWHIHELYPEVRVRLEYKPFPDEQIFIDIFVAGADWQLALELKYPTRQITAWWDDEQFALRNQGGQDLTRYDFIKDIARLERVVAAYPTTTGYALLLTNDSSFWTTARRSDTIDFAFRLQQGSILEGVRGWAAHAGISTMAKREQAHNLTGSYTLDWHDYARLPVAQPYNLFRYLPVRISRQ